MFFAPVPRWEAGPLDFIPAASSVGAVPDRAFGEWSCSSPYTRLRMLARNSFVDHVRHPFVALPCAASDIHGRRIDFVPLHDGIEEPVRATVHVVFFDDGCSVGASYFSPDE